MARLYLPLLLLLFCAACATPHDLVKVPMVHPDEACGLLKEAGYDPGECWSITDTDQMRRAIRQFQEHQRLAPAQGDLNRETWERLKLVVRNMRSQRAALAKARSGQNTAAPPPKVGSTVKPTAPTAQAEPGQAKAPAAKRARQPPPPPPPLGVGERVLVAERTKCLGRGGVWLLAYAGVVQALEGDRVWVLLRQRISYRYNPGEKGVDSQDWFCVPRRRHCYSPVSFGDWGGIRRADETVVFTKTRVRRAGGDPKDTLYELARHFCY